MSLGIATLRNRIRFCLVLSSTSRRTITYTPEESPFRARPNQLKDVGKTVGDALHETGLSDAELLATLDQYQKSAEASPAHQAPADDDASHPLEGLSNVRPHRFIEWKHPQVRAFMRYPNRKETWASSARNRNDIYAQLWGERLHANSDWSKVLTNISSFTPFPRQWHTKALEIFLTKDQLAAIRQAGSGHSLWEIGSRRSSFLGLETRQSNGRSPEESDRVIVMSGTDEALRYSVQDLVEWLGELKIQRRRPASGDEYVYPVKSQLFPTQKLSIFRHYLRWDTDRTADEIPLPEKWTPSSLESYVGKIVSSNPTTKAMQKYAQKRVTHQDTVTALIMRVLASSDSAPHDVLTISAFKLGLYFMAKKGSLYTKQLWLLFQVMPKLRIPYDTETFNIVLEHCTKSRNMLRFNTILVVMRRANLSPDITTWRMYIRMLHDPMIKRQIAHEARWRGLLRNPDDKALLATECVGDDLEYFIRSRKSIEQFSLDEFLAQQDAEYGDRKWLNHNVMPRIIEVLCRFSLFDHCMIAIQRLREGPGSHTPNVPTFNVMFGHIKRQPDAWNLSYPKLAVKILKAMEAADTPSRPVKPDSTTFDCLFRVGVKCQVPNFTAVVWRYAVMKGLTTTSMRRLVTRYLVFGKIKSSMTPYSLFLSSYFRRVFSDPVMMRMMEKELMDLLQVRIGAGKIHPPAST